MSVCEEVRIPSHGEQLAAYLYRPDGAIGALPCVVMAHGLSAARDDGLTEHEPESDTTSSAALNETRGVDSLRRVPRQTVAAALSSFSVFVASRYSCTHRSMTAAVFSTLVSCPTT